MWYGFNRCPFCRALLALDGSCSMRKVVARLPWLDANRRPFPEFAARCRRAALRASPATKEPK